MKRSPLRRKTPLGNAAPLTTGRRKRKPSEFARIYGSKARVTFVSQLPCIVCNSFPCDNMHIRGDGVSRKAGYDQIVPCCRTHHEDAHRIGIKTFAKAFDLDLKLAAIATEQRWQAHLYGGRGPEHISTIVKRVMEEL